MNKQIDEKKIKRIEDELNWVCGMYTSQKNAGYDKQAEGFWNKLHGMLNLLDIIGFDYEFDDDMKLKLVEKVLC